MDLKKIAILGALGIGGVFLASRFLGSGDNSAGAGAGGGAPPGAQAPLMAGTGEPVFNISFPEPNFPSIPQIDYNYFIDQSDTGETKKSTNTEYNYGSYTSPFKFEGTGGVAKPGYHITGGGEIVKNPSSKKQLQEIATQTPAQKQLSYTINKAYYLGGE